MSAQVVEMAENWKNCLEEELICPICLHVFVEPIQLPCKHNFCRGCISDAWAQDSGGVRCPECNHAYNQKPNLEKNIKLTNIVERFNALNAEKVPAVLQCILCRRGSTIPAQKVCLRCSAPCCWLHIQTHLQEHTPNSPNAGHLLVDVQDVRAWTCPQHDQYRLFHCEVEQVAVCQYCCFSKCAAIHDHAVCDVAERQHDMRHMLMKQQDHIDDQVQDIEEQLYELESDKQQILDKVDQLKQEVRLEYQKMQQLLEEDMGKTLEVLDKARTKFCQENSSQVLQLNKKRQEAKKLASSAQTLLNKADDINFMKNTKPVKIFVDRSQTFTGSTLAPYKAGHLSCKVFLSEVSKREKNLRKMLEAPFSTPAPFLQSIPVNPCNSRSGKRVHSVAFPESSASFLEPSGSVSKKQFPGPSTSSSEASSSQTPLASCSSTSQHIVGLSSSGSQPVHHSGSVLCPAHYPSAGSSQQAVLPPQYGSRKILLCAVDNCYCSGVPSNHRGQTPYPRSGSFHWTQEYSHPLPSTPSMSQPLQGLSVRNWIDASQSHRHPGFYGLYGQSSTKRYASI